MKRINGLFLGVAIAALGVSLIPAKTAPAVLAQGQSGASPCSGCAADSDSWVGDPAVIAITKEPLLGNGSCFGINPDCAAEGCDIDGTLTITNLTANPLTVVEHHVHTIIPAGGTHKFEWTYQEINCGEDIYFAIYTGATKGVFEDAFVWYECSFCATGGVGN